MRKWTHPKQLPAPYLHADGAPIVEAQVLQKAGAANCRTAPCPFCGYRHEHAAPRWAPIGALLLRRAHCPAPVPLKSGARLPLTPNGNPFRPVRDYVERYHLLVVRNSYLPWHRPKIWRGPVIALYADAEARLDGRWRRRWAPTFYLRHVSAEELLRPPHDDDAERDIERVTH